MIHSLHRAVFGLILSGFLGGLCAWDSDGCNEPFSDAHESASESRREERLSYGKKIYTLACASCHDPGAGPAPDIGKRDDWSGRSRLWCAVLFEHAKGGYLDMPAKGDRPELSGKDVDAAAEYMLGVTFPELPLD